MKNTSGPFFFWGLFQSSSWIPWAAYQSSLAPDQKKDLNLDSVNMLAVPLDGIGALKGWRLKDLKMIFKRIYHTHVDTVPTGMLSYFNLCSSFLSPLQCIMFQFLTWQSASPSPTDQVKVRAPQLFLRIVIELFLKIIIEMFQIKLFE